MQSLRDVFRAGLPNALAINMHRAQAALAIAPDRKISEAQQPKLLRYAAIQALCLQQCTCSEQIIRKTDAAM
ncbi:MAG: hypothetical protein EAZ37_00875 [Burkholderiales bacterium]|nr:MAG: hypothetical protein EAZ37_00875 [Burkholderiales bacterium]